MCEHILGEGKLRIEYTLRRQKKAKDCGPIMNFTKIIYIRTYYIGRLSWDFPGSQLSSFAHYYIDIWKKSL